MRRWLRRLGWGLLGLIAVLATGLGAGYLWLRQSLPQIDGEIRVAGLKAPVTVVRDRWAIPHIEAQSLHDATFAQGFVHAQDRLWQMEFQRRVGSGRLAEIVGVAGLPGDRFMRTLGLYRRAAASLAHLRPETRARLDAYAEGVNAYLASRKGPLPPEFLLLRHHEVEPWSPADSLVWLRLMALDLSVNYRDELLRARLAQRLTDEQIADVWPDYPESAPVTLVELARSLPAERLAAALPRAPDGAQGSNAWVLAGSRTATGAPLLANDPHLGLQAPGVWYLAHIQAPELELVGATLPGVPGIVLGHNGSVAWGLTNTGADVQDLFIERTDPSDPARYLAPDGSAPFEVRAEVIRVKGGPPVTLRVRETRHGPVLSDLLPDAERLFGAGEVAALAWTALAEDDRTMQALLQLNQARDWPSFVAATRDVGAPMQNILYADVAGHIGFIAPGRVPVRRQGDGRWPVPGWSGAYDWLGEIPFEDLPRALDPPAGVLFNANNPIVPGDYPYLLTADWEASYRARRLARLLAGGGHDLAAFAAIQADQRSLLAEDLLPIMLEAEAPSPAAAAALAELRAWDRVMRPDARAPLLFAAWYRELSRLIYADELGPLFAGFWRVRPRFMDRILKHRQVWCDDLTTAEVETCAGLAARALELALADLARRFGDDQERWRWGTAHPARMAHAIFGDQPLLAWLFDIRAASGGDGTTVNVG
ncbi:MAG TPA: penicillin acylase family protein, partial [Geminicoccaceae bacterium]|nr:penicillin acylase family protein [Geminicoccaceae bacterium]